ncbi:MAG: hypothetical protein GY873_27895 [Bosea sp.]|jgi:hypothetical protein|uniref:DUF6036 family nucleotidyltransferase n=1 Tax=Bosea sp. (in: a-proteobacteria) TaxID=1871050 RepID=UPI0023A4662F|nr:hypothetical protein [Bosea sp. (in: a-proteobacteria)]MCP4738020.1 hypothetical protein [Bosea sp. (in: a-proteobacteria)]
MRFDYIDKKRLEDIFEAMDEASSGDFREKQVLCIFGAAAIISYGSVARQTQDIDVWRPASMLIDRALRQLTLAAGLDFNPLEIEPDRPYLQVVDDGVVRMPNFDSETFTWATGQKNQTIWTGASLTIVAPPPEIVAAAKMVRAEPQDVEDVIFLMNMKNVSVAQIAGAIKFFPAEAREQAGANMVLLEYAARNQVRDLSRDRNGYER